MCWICIGIAVYGLHQRIKRQYLSVGTLVSSNLTNFLTTGQVSQW